MPGIAPAMEHQRGGRRSRDGGGTALVTFGEVFKPGVEAVEHGSHPRMDG